MPNWPRTDCSPATVELHTPLVRHIVGEPSAIESHSPFTSAIMQAVSTPELATALARNGGLSFLH
ncbi:IMP dehydrogenase [Streptomyces sp. NPDC005435]|uniref:IMP dehydrogenase n=1 Tax=Streptomyces sp. NPDC005435 TaxID=3154464 RepID=UPI003454AFB4